MVLFFDPSGENMYGSPGETLEVSKWNLQRMNMVAWGGIEHLFLP